MNCAKFNYNNVESSHKDGFTTIRKVSIKNGKGYKSVSKYHNGNYVGTAKKLLEGGQIQMIKNRKFIPGLFNDCLIENSRKKSKNNKKYSRKSSKK